MKLRKVFKSIVFIFLALSLTSCIELVEEMHINKDKSGTWELRLEAMGLQSLLGSIGKYLSDDMVSSWKSIPSDKIKTLNEIKGISNVEASTSGDFVIGLKFDYDNQKSLNKALYGLLGAKKKFYYPKLYKVKKHKFKKLDFGNILYKKLSEQTAKLEKTSWLEYVSFKSVYHLPSEDIVNKTKNPGNYKISGNVYTQNHNLLLLSTQDNNLGVKLKY